MTPDGVISDPVKGLRKEPQGRIVGDDHMRIFVAGATGVIGRRAVRLLAEAGHAVTGVAIGGISWFSRSVTLTSVKAYAITGECGDLFVEAFAGSTVVYSVDYGPFCDGWTTIGNLPLDGSSVSGGITRVWIDVTDKLHNGRGYADCYRSESTCLTGQY